MTKKEMDKVVTPEFRVSFPSVFKASAAPGSDKEKFSLVMLIKKSENIDVIKQLLTRAVLAKYVSKDKVPQDFNFPIKDGNDKEYDGYQDHYYITASSQFQPGVLDEQKNTMLDPKDFYAGCYAIATVNAYCWKYMGKEGVSVGLQNVMKMNDGEPLAGGSSAESDFEAIPVPETTSVSQEGGGGSVLDIM